LRGSHGGSQGALLEPARACRRVTCNDAYRILPGLNTPDEG
jgi:hypothetical protein